MSKNIKTLEQLMVEYAQRNKNAAAKPSSGRRKSSLDRPLLFSGKIPSRLKSNDNTATPSLMLTLSSLEAGYINRQELNEISLSPAIDKTKDYSFTQANDIVIGLFDPFHAAVVSDENQGIFISNLFAVIRMDDTLQKAIDPYYLAAYLNSRLINSQLRRIANHPKKNLTLNNLATIPILIADKSAQQSLGQDLRTRITLLETMKCLEHSLDEYLNTLIEDTYRHEMDSHGKSE